MEIVELTKSNMLDYAGAVNQSRAIPDARTGLKPIHRKIIYEMYTDKIGSAGKYKKCAYMVGQIIARFSEHGDSATYDALVRLAQPWIQRYPILDFHGNAGSQFGDSQAAMRYTEAKLSKLTEDGFLPSLGKETVDWMPNFTNEEMEPSTLPALFPGLFCLPNQGIGYAVACQFLTMNLSEVVDGLIEAINGKSFPILQYDLASGGIIINPEVMEKIYKTGKGTITVDSKYYIDEKNIVITEIPFNIMFDDILSEIVSLCEKEELDGISDVKNNSGNGKLEMLIEVSKGYNPEDVINQLFEKTKLRTSYGINQIALVNNTPKLLTQQEMAKIYIDHNLNCIKREFQFDLKKTQNRIEILEGLVIALTSIDSIVETIKESENPNVAKNALVETYSLTDNQAQAILDMKLSRLTKLDGVKLNQELQEKKEYADRCAAIVNSDQEKKSVLIERLTELKEKYGDKRRTEVIQKTIEKKTKNGTTKQSKPIEDVVITYNPVGYLQRIPVSLYRNNNFKAIKTTTADLVLLFTNHGRFFRISPNDIKTCGVKDKGTAIGAIVKLQPNEKVINVFSTEINEARPYLTFALNNGILKKIQKSEFLSTTRNLSGMIAVKTKDNFVVSIQESNGNDIVLGTKNDMWIRFDAESVRAMGRNAAGVKGIALSDGDEVREMIICDKTDKLISTSIGKIELVSQGRGGKGKHVTKR